MVTTLEVIDCPTIEQVAIAEPKAKIARRKFMRAHREGLHATDPHCFYCGKSIELAETTLDHVIPESRGGTTTPENLRLACNKCNLSKDDATPAEWLIELEAQADALLRLIQSIANRIKTEGFDHIHAMAPRGNGKRCLPPSKPSDWNYDRVHFRQSRSDFRLVDRASGQQVRGLRFSDAVHFLQEVGGNGISLECVCHLTLPDLDLI